jgi:hypothetical protein
VNDRYQEFGEKYAREYGFDSKEEEAFIAALRSTFPEHQPQGAVVVIEELKGRALSPMLTPRALVDRFDFAMGSEEGLSDSEMLALIEAHDAALLAAERAALEAMQDSYQKAEDELSQTLDQTRTELAAAQSSEKALRKALARSDKAIGQALEAIHRKESALRLVMPILEAVRLKDPTPPTEEAWIAITTALAASSPKPEVGPRPRVVCLCGSTRFMDAFQAANLRETIAGRIVLTIGCNTKSEADLIVLGQLTPEAKAALDELHKRKIDMSDEILVLNVGGYIGESTRSEIEYAKAHGKAIRYLEPKPEGEEA